MWTLPLGRVPGPFPHTWDGVSAPPLASLRTFYSTTHWTEYPKGRARSHPFLLPWALPCARHAMSARHTGKAEKGQVDTEQAWGVPQLPCPDLPCLGQVDSYGGFLRYKVRYELARGMLEPVQRPDVVLVGAGFRLLSRGHVPTQPGTLNQRQVQFSEVGGAWALWAVGGRGYGLGSAKV